MELKIKTLFCIDQIHVILMDLSLTVVASLENIDFILFICFFSFKLKNDVFCKSIENY